MRIAGWITKATDAHSECVTFISFPWQQWLRERFSTLRYMCTACIFKICRHAHMWLGSHVFSQAPNDVHPRSHSVTTS